MASAQLPTTGTSQSQSATQDPQAGVQSPSAGAQASGVQPGTASDLLNGQQGVVLNNPALPSVNLGKSGTSTATAAATSHQTTAKHHVNSALLAFPLVLVFLAAVLIWTIGHSAKSTT